MFVLVIFSCKRNTETDDCQVVIVSSDGSRWDYPEPYNTPALDAIAESGMRAEWVISSFPSKTFPNHYSIATVLYPDHHGLVNNSFYDPELGLFYQMGNRAMVENPDFYGGEPIRNTTEKQEVISATFFWVGSEAPVQGMLREPTSQGK